MSKINSMAGGVLGLVAAISLMSILAVTAPAFQVQVATNAGRVQQQEVAPMIAQKAGEESGTSEETPSVSTALEATSEVYVAKPAQQTLSFDLIMNTGASVGAAALFFFIAKRKTDKL